MVLDPSPPPLVAYTDVVEWSTISLVVYYSILLLVVYYLMTSVHGIQVSQSRIQMS